MARYIVVTTEGDITNAIVWDGVEEWSPPEGSTAVEQAEYEIGGTLIDDVYTPPA
jgi:hypothetical protein